MPIYSYLSFAAAKAQLAQRLYDPLGQFWGDTERGLYLVEALRTWNSLTSFWRAEFTFSTQQGIPWVDLTDTVAMPNTLRPFTQLDTSLYPIIQYHLLEPAVGVNPWTGVSKQFTAADLVSALSRRRDEVLSDAGCTITRRLVPAMAGRTILPDTTVDVRRVAYLPAGPGRKPSTLWPDDLWAEQSFNRTYIQQPAGTPLSYLMSAQPPISFDTDRAPDSAGSYELLTIEALAGLSATVPSLLRIPDDWCYVLKWGALADLLSRESNSKDALRAKYCEQRYRMGLALLSHAAALLAMRNTNAPILIDSVWSADQFRPRWEAEPQGEPDMILHAGLNLIALAPTPDSGLLGTNYSLTPTVVQNAPVPLADADFLQVSRDDVEVVLDYAQHLAMFKCGGAEFAATIPLFRRFLDQAAFYGLKLAELGEFTEPIYGLSALDIGMHPRVSIPAGQPADEAA